VTFDVDCQVVETECQASFDDRQIFPDFILDVLSIVVKTGYGVLVLPLAGNPW